MNNPVMADIYDALLHVLPIVIALIVAVVKIGNMFDSKVELIKNEFRKEINLLWESQNRQDQRFERLARDHYRLEGRHGLRERTSSEHNED